MEDSTQNTLTESSKTKNSYSPFSQNPFNKLFIVAVSISLGTIIILVVTAIAFQARSKLNVQSPLSLENSNKVKPSSENAQSKCSYYGSLDKDFYLNKYTVQKGDTLLKIAENELGDNSRVGELIELNKTWYPNLSISKPDIKEGWELRIPPNLFPKSSGYLEGFGGEISRGTDKWIVTFVDLNQRTDPSLQAGWISYITPQTKYLGTDSFKTGDCVYIIRSMSFLVGDPTAGILVISPQDKNYFKDTSIAEIKNSNEKKKCEYYGYLDKDFFLTKYTVRRGDTISSVARTQLGSESRVDELIKLNKTWYPHLSRENPFLEVGWTLRLPPKFITKSSGILEGLGGEIISQTDKWYEIDLHLTTPGFDEGSGYITYKNPNAKYLGKDSFKEGDCVYVIDDYSENIATSVAYYIVAISPQDKNYFK